MLVILGYFKLRYRNRDFGLVWVVVIIGSWLNDILLVIWFVNVFLFRILLFNYRVWFIGLVVNGFVVGGWVVMGFGIVRF